MELPDVNILVNAFRSDTEDHSICREWLERTASSDSAFGLSSLALSSMIRIVSHPRIFRDPDSAEEALRFADTLLQLENCELVSPGTRHWSIFSKLCSQTKVSGNLIPDAYLAALAIEHGCTWITLDRDFDRFPGLTTKKPTR